jgi:hypothetical protein
LSCLHRGCVRSTPAHVRATCSLPKGSLEKIATLGPPQERPGPEPPVGARLLRSDGAADWASAGRRGHRTDSARVAAVESTWLPIQPRRPTTAAHTAQAGRGAAAKASPTGRGCPPTVSPCGREYRGWLPSADVDVLGAVSPATSRGSLPPHRRPAARPAAGHAGSALRHHPPLPRTCVTRPGCSATEPRVLPDRGAQLNFGQVTHARSDNLGARSASTTSLQVGANALERYPSFIRRGCHSCRRRLKNDP